MDDKKQIVATARGYGEFKGQSGKLEEGETPQQTLVREIKEELEIITLRKRNGYLMEQHSLMEVPRNYGLL